MAERAGLLHAAGLAAAQRSPGPQHPGRRWDTVGGDTRGPQAGGGQDQVWCRGDAGSPGRAPSAPASLSPSCGRSQSDHWGQTSARVFRQLHQTLCPAVQTGWTSGGRHLHSMGCPARVEVAVAGTLRPWTGQPAWPSSTSFSLPDDKSELEGSTLSMLSATSTASHLLPPQERLREKAFEYCQRLVEQSTRRESCCRASSPRGRLALLAGAWSLDSLFVPGGLCVPRPKPQGAGQGAEPVPSPPGICVGGGRCPSLRSQLAFCPLLELPEQGAFQSLF